MFFNTFIFVVRQSIFENYLHRCSADINICFYQKSCFGALVLAFFARKQLEIMVLHGVVKITGLGMRIQSLCGSEAVWKHGSFELVHLGGNRILQQQPRFWLRWFNTFDTRWFPHHNIPWLDCFGRKFKCCLLLQKADSASPFQL